MQDRPFDRCESAGFTLLELTIVTAVLGVLAGVAVPNLLSGRLVANETAMIATMRAIATAQVQFQSQGEADADAMGADNNLWTVVQ